MRALIANGGLGRRLLEITKAPTPKGHVFFNGKPLIAYQMEILLKLGIRDVAICYTFPYQIASFNQLVKEGKIPQAMRYKLIVGPFEHEGYSHPYLMFLAKELRNFLAGHPFIKLYGDEMAKPLTITRMVKGFKNTHETVLIKYRPKAKQPFIVLNDKQGYITRFEPLGELYWPYNIGGLAVFSKKDQDILFGLAAERLPHATLFIREALKRRRKIRLLPVRNYINMNTKEDYYDMVKFIERYFR